MKVKFKRLNPFATVPGYAKSGDACFDLVATSIRYDDSFIEYGTGIAIEVPQGHVGLIFPRSSVTNKGLMLKNSVGVIDSGYRGEIKFRYTVIYESIRTEDLYQVGDRIGQMMILPIPTVELQEVDELSDSERGEGGYGSSGR